MKYFTKEELEDITKELIENPTRETLKMLNEKYNGTNDTGASLLEVIPSTPLETPVPAPEVSVAESQVEQTPFLSIPNVEQSKVEVAPTNTENTTQVPSFELPKFETPTFNTQNIEPINFSGNLFETPMQEANNLMQTTDNFNSTLNTMPNTEVQVSPTPFFVANSEPVNNPIPIGGSLNSVPTTSPSMFGEFEQNYM